MADDANPTRRPSDPSRIVCWDAAELSAAIRDRVVSCVEVMTAYLDHIDEINPKVNAIVSLRPRVDLVAEAAEKDRLLRAGRHQGWMHGFPHAVKDLADVAGIPTTHGFLRGAFAPAAATTDALFVERIRAAGAIFIGKTNTPEFGLGSHTYNEVFGTTLNAYDRSRSAGGSSGGGAVAVALRMVPVADGSDFMGSLRNPPGWNNVFGLRPSVGRVPHFGGEQFVSQAGVIGPIARTATDLALLLETMSGYDDRSPLSIPGHGTFAAGLDGSVHGKKVAWLGDLGGYLPMEPEVLEIGQAALSDLAALGMTVTTLDDLPSAGTFAGNDSLWPTWLAFRHWLSGMALKPTYDIPEARALMKPEALYEVDGLRGIDAVAVYEANAARSDMYEGFRVLFQTFDYVVLPTAQVMPFDASLRWPQVIGEAAMTSYHRWMEVSTIATLINAPALAMPAGFGKDGLPIGLQVIGPHHGEHELLRLARAWEQLTGWVHRRPPGQLRSEY
jgi:amidase